MLKAPGGDLEFAVAMPAATVQRLACDAMRVAWVRRPASWTNAHHIKHRALGGATDLDNLVHR